MAPYNGHKNWNHWNVSLWINNEEWLYDLALRCLRSTPNRDAAVHLFLDHMRASNTPKTPDGAKYSHSSVRAAMRGL